MPLLSTPNGRLLGAITSAEKLYGYTDFAFRRLSLSDLVDDDDGRVQDILGKAINGSYRHRPAGSREFDVQVQHTSVGESGDQDD